MSKELWVVWTSGEDAFIGTEKKVREVAKEWRRAGFRPTIGRIVPVVRTEQKVVAAFPAWSETSHNHGSEEVFDTVTELISLLVVFEDGSMEMRRLQTGNTYEAYPVERR